MIHGASSVLASQPAIAPISATRMNVRSPGEALLPASRPMLLALESRQRADEAGDRKALHGRDIELEIHSRRF